MHTAFSVLAMILGLTVCGTASVRADCSGTRAVLWLHVPKDVLEELLNRAVPERMEGRQTYNALMLFGEHIRWSMERGPITLVTGAHLIQARTTVTGSVKVKGRSLIGTDFSAGPNLTIDVALSMRPWLVEGWRVYPNAKASAWVNDAKMKILGIEVSVKGQSQQALDKYLAHMEEQINTRFADGRFVRKEVERIWKGMHRVDRVAIERLPGSPPAWFVARPTRIGATNLRLNEDGLGFGVSVFAKTDLVIGNKPPPSVQPLPPLEIDDDLPEGNIIELALPIFVDWKTANDLIAAHLEEPFVHVSDYSRLVVTSARLSSDSGESLVATVMAKVEPKGWIGWILYYIQRFLGAIGLDTEYMSIYVDHEIAVSAKPVLSEDGRHIALRDARLMPRSAHLRETLAADYYGLTEESLRKFVEKHAVVALDERLAEAERMAREKIGELTGKLGDRGLDLNVEIRPATRIASVSARPEGLIARFCAAAKIDAKILREHFIRYNRQDFD